MGLFGKRKDLENKKSILDNSQQIMNDIIPDLAFQGQKKTPFQLIEEAIEKNPKSAMYRVPIQQTSANIHTMDAERFLELAKKRFVALDLETTGLDDVDDQIVEICAVRVENGKITSVYNQLVDPGIKMPIEATAINGITDEMIAGKPKIYEVMPDLLYFFSNDVVAAHNAGFDVRFILQACMRYRFKLHRKYFDTMDLRPYWPGLKNRKFSTFLSAAGLTNNNPHRAEGDAEALAHLIIKTIEKYSGNTP